MVKAPQLHRHNLGSFFYSFISFKPHLLPHVARLLHIGYPDHTIVHPKNPPIENNIQFINPPLGSSSVKKKLFIQLSLLFSILLFSLAILVLFGFPISHVTFKPKSLVPAFLQILAIILIFSCFAVLFLQPPSHSNCSTIVHKTTTTTPSSNYCKPQFGQNMQIHCQQLLQKAI